MTSLITKILRIIFIFLTMIAVSRLMDDNSPLFPYGLYWLVCFLLITALEAALEASQWLENDPDESSKKAGRLSASSKFKKQKGWLNTWQKMKKEFAPQHWAFAAFAGVKKTFPVFFMVLTVIGLGLYFSDKDIFPFGLYWLLSLFLTVIFGTLAVQVFQFESSEVFGEMSGKKFLALAGDDDPDLGLFSGKRRRRKKKTVKIPPPPPSESAEIYRTNLPFQTRIMKKERGRLVKSNLTETEINALKAYYAALSARKKRERNPPLPLVF